MIKGGATTKPYVFDPSLFDKPVPAEEWIALCTKNLAPDQAHSAFFNGTTYGPGEICNDYDTKQIDPQSIRDSSEVLKGYKTVQDSRTVIQK